MRGDVVVVCLVCEDRRAKPRCPITLFCAVGVSTVSLTGWDDGRVADTAQGGSQLSIDVAWSPACVDGRCFNHLGLSQHVDYMVLMACDL